MWGCKSDSSDSPSASPQENEPTATTTSTAVNDESPNFLVFIADDFGVDVSKHYSYSTDVPSTPSIDLIQGDGIVFENFWVTPACTTTRGSLISGLHAFSSKIDHVPAVIPSNTKTIQQALKSDFLKQKYQTGIFGKWHLGGQNASATQPNDFGVDNYFGNLFNLPDYFNWDYTKNGEQGSSTTYHTTVVGDEALAWIDSQPASQPWFAWVAFSAPHVPFHNPPDELLSQYKNAESNRDKYFAMVEAMDTTIGKVLSGLREEAKKNTIIVFMGDNGTPLQAMTTEVFEKTKGKGTVYEGGIRTPLIIGGEPVINKGTRHSALVNITDFFATFMSLANSKEDLPAGLVNTDHSYNFSDLLTEGGGSNPRRTTNYSEFIVDSKLSWTVRNDRYKYIFHDSGTEELFDISVDIREENDLSGDSSLQTIFDELKNTGKNLRGESSGTTQDGEDIRAKIFTRRDGSCKEYIGDFHANVTDVKNSKSMSSSLKITYANNECTWVSNSIPNHDYNDGNSSFVTNVSEVVETFNMPSSPSFASGTTSLTLQYDNAIFLNGVKLDLLAAACYGIGTAPLGQEKVGCGQVKTPWRYDPMFSDNSFRTDTHNAHTQPDGAYHYHGTPNALYDQSGNTESGVVGFAADGYPIFGPFIDDSGTIRAAISGYSLKAGARTSQANEGAFPGGNHDGTYRDDYEYTGSGDLDECNGMTRNGVYGYYITNSFPWVLNCFNGTPDESFSKN